MESQTVTNRDSMQMEGTFLENVLIKEVTGFGDKVFVVSRLPKSLLYVKAQEQKPVVVTMPNGSKDQVLQPTGKIVDELLPGIEMSQTGDGGFVFWDKNEAKQHLKAIDKWISQICPPTMRIPEREYYARTPRDQSSPAKHISQVVRVEIPMSPPSEKSDALDSPSALADFKAKMKEELRNEIMQEILAESKRERAAHARAAKTSPVVDVEIIPTEVVEKAKKLEPEA